MLVVRCRCLLSVVCLLAAGCASAPLNSARVDFYAGRLDKAETTLSTPPETERNMVLFLMERGTLLQAAGKYEQSTAEWLRAVELLDKLETRSATETTASFVVNDRTMSFRGVPFERTLLRAFLAKNYLARGMWEDAGVEARNIIENLQNLNGYPDDAYSRYLTGFCLELLRDNSNAALQYRNAANLMEDFAVDERTGMISPRQADTETKQPAKPDVSRRLVRRSLDVGGSNGPEGAKPDKSFTHELVCFLLLGRSPTGVQSRYPMPVARAAPYAEIYWNGRLLGRSYPFADTADLIRKTQERTAVLRAAKDATRLVAKEAIASQVKKKDENLGELVELLLFAFEIPDDRRWETLPRWLQIARVPCPADLKSYAVIIKNREGKTLRTITVSEPISCRGRTFISLCRDLPIPEKKD